MLETKKFDSLESLQGWLDDNADTIGAAREFTLITEQEPRSTSGITPPPPAESVATPPEPKEMKKMKDDEYEMEWSPDED